MKKLRLNYITIPLIVAGVAALGGIFTSSGMRESMWYENLTLPTWAPESIVISTAWTIIFICAAISIILIWNSMRRIERFRQIIRLFIANGIFNLGWSYIFFIRHSILAAFIDALLIALSVLAIIWILYEHEQEYRSRPLRWARILLYPYLIWTIFASYLTYTIWMLN